MIKILLWGIKAYQLLVSPLFPPSCRFVPSCSHYCYEALNTYGLFKGVIFCIRRVLRCNPWSKGGYDPLP